MSHHKKKRILKPRQKERSQLKNKKEFYEDRNGVSKNLIFESIFIGFTILSCVQKRNTHMGVKFAFSIFLASLEKKNTF